MLPLRLCIASILAGKKPATLPAGVTIDNAAVATIAPPPPKKETAPSERDGVIWSPGYWKYADNWFVWCAGHWELSRPGQSYAAPHWDSYTDGWHFHPGRWSDEAASNAVKKPGETASANVRYDALGAFR